MPRYKLIVEYDGTPYSGWQHQADRHTVQQAIEQALFKFCGERRRLSTAGRTDAGVHAMHQVAHVDLNKAWRTDVVRDALNAHLSQADEAVAILSVEVVPESFNARLSARRRHYLYRIADRRPPLTFDRLRAWHVPRSLDVAAMHAAAQLLVGHHDFTSFRASDCQGRTPMKTLERLDVSRNGAEVELHAAARSFLHHQVRFMVGTLAQVGLGRWPVEAVGTVLAARDLQRAGPMAPAHGLYFIGVDY